MIQTDRIINADCIEALKTLPDNSVDSIITDPPYELGFMGKSWDSTGVAYNVDVWKESLRVLKPGGHLLAFGGTRTYHRMACAVEDAGFEVRDQLQWIYGSGFPKSMDISKAIDKAAGAVRKVVATKETHDIRSNGLMDKKGAITVDITAPTTPEAIQGDGWGTALKPANEPIVLARKPLAEKTIAANVLCWGTGGINIDDCGIPRGTDDISGWSKTGTEESDNRSMSGKNYAREAKPDNPRRFPANVIFDESAATMLDEQTGTLKSGKMKAGTKYGQGTENNVYNTLSGETKRDTIGDSGGASRFFYCAKASKADRGEGNTHPTVKPTKLMEYLVKLITPPKGIVLDPFCGSGSTLKAAQQNGFKAIGIDADLKSCGIAKKRTGYKIEILLNKELEDLLS